ncbi:MAG: YybH family protein [Solirubrobacterales bacterium]
MRRADLERWIEAYVRLWRTAGTDALSEIFSDDALYSPAPFEEPRRGLEAISALWEAERLGPGEDFELDSEVVAVDGGTGVVRVEVRYGRPRDTLYRDLWIVRVGGDGRCTRFEEWPFWPPGAEGSIAGRGSTPGSA